MQKDTQEDTLERFLLVSGKTLIDLLNTLNTGKINLARIVYLEKSKDGYTAVIDTEPLFVITYHDLGAFSGNEVQSA